MYTDRRSSVVRVLASDGRHTAGTAFFCLPKGYLATCTHVLDAKAGHNQRVRLQFFPADSAEPVELEATICTQWSSAANQEDLTILQLIGDLPSGAMPLAFGIGKPRLGSPVDSYGYPVHNPVFGMPGHADFVGMTREATSGTDVYVVRGDSIARGFSGGPCILRETGEVLGVISALTTADLEGRWPKGAFVVPAENVLRLCPVLVAGTPPLVQALIHPWDETWNPFEKYASAPAFRDGRDVPYEFPMLEEITESSLRILLAMDALAEQLDSNQPKVAILVGGPGTGKSRLLAEIARRVSRTDSDIGLTRQLVPILVTAKSYAEARGTTAAEHLGEALRLDGALPSIRAIDADAIETLLSEGRYRCVVMIDGADELPDPIRRKQLFNRAAADGKALTAAGHLVILSTRPLDETGSRLLKSISISYRLPLLDEDASSRLANATLGHDADEFKRTATATGLISYLDTPLLFNLAATLFVRRPTDFPSTILGIYQQFLSLMRETWEDTPTKAAEVIKVIGSIAIGSLAAPDDRNNLDAWVTEIDLALQDAFRCVRGAQGGDIDDSLYTAQAVINFGLQSSGLMYRQGTAVQWSHLLLRDYLAANHLQTMARTDEAKVQNILNERFANSFWREALILFVVGEAPTGRAERMLWTIREDCGEFTLALTLFIKDCLHRGAVFQSHFLDELFRAFAELAIEDQDSFGSCAKVFSPDYGVFWHLLRLQRIPQAQTAIRHAVSHAAPGTIMSEWPNSARSKVFTPRNLYIGRLATAPSIFAHEE